MSFFSKKNYDITGSSLNEIKRQMDTHKKVYSKAPSKLEGVDGDIRIVVNGDKRYLYLKVLGSWVKNRLTEGEVQATGEATDTTETTTTTGTGASPTALALEVQYDGTETDELEGWDTYLKATKDSADTGYTATTASTSYAKPDLANGSTMYTTVGATTAWTPHGLTSGSSPNFHYFAMNASPYSLMKINYAGVISGVRSRVPSTLEVTGEALSATSIRLTISGNTEVTETVRIYYKTAAAGSFTEVTSSISTSDNDSSHSFTYDLTSLTASTTYNIKVRGENGAPQNSTGADSDTINVATISSTPSWSNVPGDFTLTAFGLPSETVGEYATAAKTITITNGTAATNSTTVSLSKDSGEALEYEVALSTSGDPGIGGTANSGTGYASSRSVNLGTGTLYMRFRHRFKLSYVGYNANISVTFSNTNGSLADNTDLDITMVNTTGPG